MKAMVLAAGLGTRLGTLTRNMPKCLMEVGDKPILQYVLRRLVEAGVTSTVINLYHRGELIEEHLANHPVPGLQINFSREPQLLGTGGALRHARKFLDDGTPFIIHNSDIYSSIDLKALWNAHTQSNALVTLAVMNRSTTRPLLFDADMNLRGRENLDRGTAEAFGDTGELSSFAFTGIQVVSPRFFSFLVDKPDVFDSIGVYLEAAKAGERILGHDASGSYWLDMGTPENLQELRTLLEGNLN